MQKLASTEQIRTEDTQHVIFCTQRNLQHWTVVLCRSPLFMDKVKHDLDALGWLRRSDHCKQYQREEQDVESRSVGRTAEAVAVAEWQERVMVPTMRDTWTCNR
jgi:hypothetical protein